MEERTPDPTQPQAEPRHEPRRLLRSRDDRMIFGVAGGLGRYFDVDPVIFRIGFGVSLVFGGLGLIAYLALALFVPTDDGSANPEAPFQRSRGWALAAGLFLLLAVLPALGAGLFWGGWSWTFWVVIPALIVAAMYAVYRERQSPPAPPAAGPGTGAAGETATTESLEAAAMQPRRDRGSAVWSVLVALAAATGFLVLFFAAAVATALGVGVFVAGTVALLGVVLIGVGLAGGGAWLILPAAALALGVGVGAATDLEIDGGIGERSYRPVSAAAIPAGGYELGIGEITVDLRELDWRRDREVRVDFDVGIGEAVVAVPADVCVTGEAHAKAGTLTLAGEQADGFDIDQAAGFSEGRGKRLIFDGELDLGEMVVINDDGFQPGGRGGDFHGSNRPSEETMREANRRACEL